MERDFNTDEFEAFLKQKTDQYKIYPSEKSWKNIHRSLHSRWKWFTLGGSLLLLSGLFFFSNDLMFSTSSRNSSRNKNYNQPDTHPSTRIASQSIEGIRQGESVTTMQLPVKRNSVNTVGESVARSSSSTSNANIFSPGDGSLSITQPLIIREPVMVDPDFARQFADENADPISKTNMEIAPLLAEEAAKSGEINWKEEVAAIKLSSKKTSPFNLQFYFSPSVSYRRLADNKPNSTVNQQNVPLSSNNSSIDRFVDHKPSIGAEIGSNILFSAGRNLTFKTGLQLNYSRYTIKAYKFYFEKASIALNSLGPVGDTLTAFTSFRNFSGYSPEELQNQYLQLSVPIGAELKLIGSKRLQFNIAGTIQPTYLLLNDTYLLSTDYVNYAKEPSLIRKWNVHTSMEAFVSYRVGGVRWQVGPQFRYQLMSSYNDRYPIKEYLFEYGVKVGVSKTLR